MSTQTLRAVPPAGTRSRRLACPRAAAARRTARAPRATRRRSRSPRPRPGRSRGRSRLRALRARRLSRQRLQARRRTRAAAAGHRGGSPVPNDRPASRSWSSSRRAALRRRADAAARFAESRARMAPDRSADERLHARLAQRAWLALDLALVPEGEGEQPPELARQVFFARNVAVDQRRHRSGPEEPLAPERVGAQRLAGKRLELASQPRRRGDREAALLAPDDPARHERRDRLAQQHLLAQAS